MDRFNVEVEEGSEEAIAAACVEMVKVTAIIARHFKVCPTCLTYAFADSISEAEERGVIGHGLLENEPEEEGDGEPVFVFNMPDAVQ
jgi:hypothetical protein